MDRGVVIGHVNDKREWIVLDALAPIILANTKGCVVDIGAGMSTEILGKWAERYNKTQITCDSSKKRLNSIGPLHSKHSLHHGKSVPGFINTFKATAREIPALVFLDGCHEYEVISAEFKCFIKMLEPGGVIFLHDTHPVEPLKGPGKGCGEVWRVAAGIEARDDLWSFAWPYTAEYHGLMMVMKKWDRTAQK